jgi:Domain of unknown function (DUF4261)
MPDNLADPLCRNGFWPVYLLELFASDPVTFDEQGLLNDLATSLGRVEQSPQNTLLHYVLKDFPVQFQDGSGAAQVLVGVHPRGRPKWDVSKSVGQSWRLPNADQRLSTCQHSALISDLMSSPLDHHQRRTILSAVLRAAVRNSNVELVHFIPTMQLVDAQEALMELSTQRERISPTYGFLNVRLYRVLESGNDMVLDTLGLSALGLTDVQIHCHDLDANTVANVVRSLGSYLFEHGDVIETGHTVPGIPEWEKWRCQRELSLVEPSREVIDIYPGSRFAAGSRSGA